MACILPFEGKSPKIAADVFVAPTAAVVGDVEIGEGSSIWFGASVRGDFQPIRIGKYSNIQDNTTIHVMGDHGLTIGDEVIIGHNCVIHSNKIGSHSLIMMGTILLGYTEIGENVIIGPGSLIPQGRKIPSNSLVLGEPAQLIRSLRDDEIEALHASALNYHEIAQNIRLSSINWLSRSKEYHVIMEKTLVLIKPDAVAKHHIGDITKRYEEEGLRPVAMKMLKMDERLASIHYAEHIGRPYYPDLTGFMTSGPIIAMVLEGEDAIKKVRALNGKTNPAEAAEGTIRKQFATASNRNAVHASDSPDSAQREIHIFFNETEIYDGEYKIPD